MIILEEGRAVEELMAQKVVVIFQGESEWGPRALGNRSILFDPRNRNAKELVNLVKRREPFRPYAGTIMLEHAHDYFEMLTLKESPYMTFAIKAKQKAIDELPGIIHVDNTCRIQTVTEEQNYYFYNLIKNFYQRTGCPALFNTSFNLHGFPIVQKLEAAMDVCYNENLFLYTPGVSNGS